MNLPFSFYNCHPLSEHIFAGHFDSADLILADLSGLPFTAHQSPSLVSCLFYQSGSKEGASFASVPALLPSTRKGHVDLRACLPANVPCSVERLP